LGEKENLERKQRPSHTEFCGGRGTTGLGRGGVVRWIVSEKTKQKIKSEKEGALVLWREGGIRQREAGGS